MHNEEVKTTVEVLEETELNDSVVIVKFEEQPTIEVINQIPEGVIIQF